MLRARDLPDLLPQRLRCLGIRRRVDLLQITEQAAESRGLVEERQNIAFMGGKPPFWNLLAGIDQRA